MIKNFMKKTFNFLYNNSDGNPYMPDVVNQDLEIPSGHKAILRSFITSISAWDSESQLIKENNGFVGIYCEPPNVIGDHGEYSVNSEPAPDQQIYIQFDTGINHNELEIELPNAIGIQGYCEKLVAATQYTFYCIYTVEYIAI